MSLAQEIDQLLPQWQCRQCGYPDCFAYATAIAEKKTKHNRCPPGGKEGIQRLSLLLNVDVLNLDPACGQEGPRMLAVIDPERCIGCTLCIQACPVDAIVGAAKQMHVVLPQACTGCNLCVSSCPVNCISENVINTASAWDSWSLSEAKNARTRYHALKKRKLHAKKNNKAPCNDQTKQNQKALLAKVWVKLKKFKNTER